MISHEPPSMGLRFKRGLGFREFGVYRDIGFRAWGILGLYRLYRVTGLRFRVQGV